MSFKRMPPDLTTGLFTHVSPSDNAARRMDSLAQIAKFGIPGTDMPGHEYLPDKDVASLSLWLSQMIARPSHNP
jgi:cytochrome c oxidase cbb3-type subunit 2